MKKMLTMGVSVSSSSIPFAAGGAACKHAWRKAEGTHQHTLAHTLQLPRRHSILHNTVGEKTGNSCGFVCVPACCILPHDMHPAPSTEPIGESNHSPSRTTAFHSV